MSRDADSPEAIRRIEEVEEHLATLVREANDEVEETTMSPVIGADDVDSARQKLTDARSDLVSSLIDAVFEEMADE